MSMSSPAPVDDGAPALLLSIPIECRHILYSHVAAARPVKPRDTLRYWFEKQDIQEQIVENVKNDPNANVTYVAGYNDRYDGEDEVEEEDGQEVAVADGQEVAVADGQEVAVADGQEVAVADEEADEVEDEDGVEDEDEDEDEDNEDEEDNVEDGEGDEDDLVTDEDVGDIMAHAAQQSAAAADTAQGGNVTTTVSSADTVPASGQDIAADEAQAAQNNLGATDADLADSEEEEEEEEAAHDPEEEQVGEDADVADGDEDETTAATSTQADSGPPAPQVVVVRPNRKWRHVPKFMRLTQCPPETNLFLISKQLNNEVKAWFYDVATLKIDATASFLHLTFFELALNKLAEAPFSPMENIKKAEITFVWDTTWIRAEESGFAGAVFPVFLQNRANFILEILLRAPELENVLIHWHDSAEDDGAKQLRADTLEPFILNLKAKVDIQDHYITPDTKPRAKSRAGKQRLEFKAIIDNGCETF
ncbi:hypothetical protein BU23DRAFT_42606 [Bimuria novae-zelandiae CBS 107.79]|uniref:Uncharacterized protein n=1 Tax=Bimuria novae-zelandiae CBS 107.79 TaxID=1447943 RepID=A0A6A5VHM8_9PLEO|nr:hypothetical protein BU23DRAFT_42606 [Bimuria novae-zelandiae CBS 107.79]